MGMRPAGSEFENAKFWLRQKSLAVVDLPPDEREPAMAIVATVQNLLRRLDENGAKFSAEAIAAAIGQTCQGRENVHAFDRRIDRPTVGGNAPLPPMACGAPVESCVRLATARTDAILHQGATGTELLKRVRTTSIPGPHRAEFCRLENRPFATLDGYRILEPGTVLVRCAQRGSQEPGRWWADLRDLALRVDDVRNRLAVRPEWNQNGLMEVLVVPSEVPVAAFIGAVAAQALAECDLAPDDWEAAGLPATAIGRAQPIPEGAFLTGGAVQYYLCLDEIYAKPAMLAALEQCILIITPTNIAGFLTGP
jgi:hypothetical protein